MADKDNKGVDKLSEALRRAEEAVLKLDRQPEDKNKKEKKTDTKKDTKQDIQPDIMKGEEREKKKRVNLDELILGKAPAKPPKQKPIQTSKPSPGPSMVDSDKKEKRPVEKSKSPASSAASFAVPPTEKKKPADRPSPNLSFGEVDLGGSADAGASELELRDTQPGAQPAAEKAPSPAPPPPQPTPAEIPEVKPVEREHPPRRVTTEETRPLPPRSHARQIKITLIIVLILAAIAAGVFGFLKWRASAEAERAAEKEKLDASSRDSLMDDSYKKEKFR